MVKNQSAQIGQIMDMAIQYDIGFWVLRNECLVRENSEDIFASSCEQNSVTCHVTQSETELLLELLLDSTTVLPKT